MAGYADIQSFYYQLNAAWSTHLQSYGQLSSPSLYRALHRLADAYPDPSTGENTAISSTLDTKFTRVFILHPEQEISADSLVSVNICCGSEAELGSPANVANPATLP